MDVPLALTDIEVQQGFKGYTRKSSTFCHQTGVVGLFGFYAVSIMRIIDSGMIEKLSSSAL